MHNPFVYRFQTRVKKQSVHEKLAKFLKEKDGDLTEKERVWWAVSAFWLPVAMKEANSYTEKEIAQYGLSAIQRLQHQIAYLALVLDLEVPSCSVPTSNRLTEFDTIENGEGESAHRRSQKINQVNTCQQVGSETEQSDEVLEETELALAPNTAFSTDSSDFDDVFGYK